MKTLDDVTTDQLDKRVAGRDVVIIDFYTPACTICTKMEPMLAALQESESERVDVVKVNAEANPDAAVRYNVRGVPFLALVKSGALADQKVGFATMTDLRSWLRPHLD